MEPQARDRIKVEYIGGSFEGAFVKKERDEHDSTRFVMETSIVVFSGPYTLTVLEKHLIMPKAQPGDVILLDGHHPVLCWRTTDGTWDVIGNTISETDVLDPVAWAREHSWHVDKIVKYGVVS